MAIKFLNTATAATQAVGDNSTKIATTAYADAAASAIPIGNYLPLAGGTMSGNIAMGDNDITGIDQLIFQEGSYFDDVGSSNYIRLKYNSAAGGGLRVEDSDGHIGGYLYSDGSTTSSFGLLDGTGSWAVRCVENAYVELRYNDSAKLQTTSAGVIVTGEGIFTGNVGIGTTSPDTKFNVTDGGTQVAISNTYLAHLQSASNCGLAITAGASSNNYIAFGDSDNYDEGIINYNNSTRSFAFRTADGALDDLVIDSAGDVGIGTTNPTAKLDVNGNVIITTSGAVNNLLLTSTDTTTAGAPDIVLYADAPAVTGDTMGDILFQGQNGMVPTSTSPLTYTGLFSKMVDKDNNHSSLVITTHKGNGSGAQALTATLSAKGVNNSATGTLLINPSSVTDVADYNLEVKGDALIQDNFYVNGNVGIGTTSPGAKLEIEGDATSNDTAQLVVASGGVDSNSIIHFSDDDGGQITAIGALEGSILTLASLNELVFKTGTSSILGSTNTKMTILTNGNTGIGTIAPLEKLTVAGTDSYLAAQQTSYVWGGSGTIGAKLGTNSSSGILDMRRWTGTGTSHGTVAITQTNQTGGWGLDFKLDAKSTNTVATTSRMFISLAGNVGIGTKDPLEKLEVQGTVYATPISYAANQSAYVLKMGASNNTAFDMGIKIKSTSTGAPYMSLCSATTEDLITLVGGNIGIGVTNPFWDLDVAGDIRIRDQGKLYFGNSGSIPFLEIYSDSSNNMVIDDVYTNNADVLFNIQGNIGMGNTTPAAKLDIVNTSSTSSSGLLKLKSTTVFSSAPGHMIDFIRSNNTIRGFVGMNQYGVTYSTSSDYRLKRNIVPIADSIDRIKKLKPSRFNWDDGPDDYVVDGFIAHEVADVIPEAITGEKDDVDKDNAPIYQSIDQSKIVPLLTAALQQAIDKIEALEVRINKLENK